YTNYKLSKTKTFRVKNLLSNLPTISQLHKYYPNIIKTKQCIHCDQSDDSIHWLFCPNSQLIFDIIKSNIQSNFTTNNLDILPSQLLHLQNSFINHHSYNYHSHFLIIFHSIKLLQVLYQMILSNYYTYILILTNLHAN